jgi:hypothetical protein
MTQPMPKAPNPMEWREVASGEQPTCPCCDRHVRIPILFHPSNRVLVRKKPPLGGRGPESPRLGWVGMTYRHRSCDSVLELQVEGAR